MFIGVKRRDLKGTLGSLNVVVAHKIPQQYIDYTSYNESIPGGNKSFS
jgi:hypothetical protein